MSDVIEFKRIVTFEAIQYDGTQASWDKVRSVLLDRWGIDAYVNESEPSIMVWGEAWTVPVGGWVSNLGGWTIHDEAPSVAPQKEGS